MIRDRVAPVHQVWPSSPLAPWAACSLSPITPQNPQRPRGEPGRDLVAYREPDQKVQAVLAPRQRPGALWADARQDRVV